MCTWRHFDGERDGERLTGLRRVVLRRVVLPRVVLRRVLLRRATAAAVLALAGVGMNPAKGALLDHASEAAWLGAVTLPTSRIDFDDLPDGTPVSNQYAAVQGGGVQFAPLAGGMLFAAAESSPHSLANLLSVDNPQLGGAGGFAIAFAAPRQGVGFWYADSQFVGNTVSVYGAADQLLGSFELPYPHPTEWLFIGFTSTAAATDISRIGVTMGDADRVTFDDFRFTAAVPEPASGSLLAAGSALLALLGLARRRGWRAAAH